MAEPAATGKSLKERNKWAVRAAIIVHAVVFIGVVYAPEATRAYEGFTAGVSQLDAGAALALGGRTLPLVGLGIAILGMIQTILGGLSAGLGDFREALIHWCWPCPLPGRRAFTLTGPRSSRVDMARLEKEHGRLPTNPCDQNRLWFGIYQTVKYEHGVLDAHGQYLLARDVAMITLILTPTLPVLVAAATSDPSLASAYAGALAAAFVVLAIVAQGYGRRLVENVFADASFQDRSPQSDAPISSPTPAVSVG